MIRFCILLIILTYFHSLYAQETTLHSIELGTSLRASALREDNQSPFLYKAFSAPVYIRYNRYLPDHQHFILQGIFTLPKYKNQVNGTNIKGFSQYFLVGKLWQYHPDKSHNIESHFGVGLKQWVQFRNYKYLDGLFSEQSGEICSSVSFLFEFRKPFQKKSYISFNGSYGLISYLLAHDYNPNSFYKLKKLDSFRGPWSTMNFGYTIRYAAKSSGKVQFFMQYSFNYLGYKRHFKTRNLFQDFGVGLMLNWHGKRNQGKNESQL